MIRTRDFFLYVLVLVFLLIAAVYTGLVSNRETAGEAKPVVFTDTTIDPDAEQIAVESNRSSRLAILREKLAAGEGEVISAPPVFTSVDTVVVDQPATTSGSQDRIVQYCSAPTAHAAVATWPDNVLVVETPNNLRATYDVFEAVVVGTSTETVRTEFLLADIPLRTVRSTFDSCLPDTTVGVRLGGGYIDNQSAAFFTSYAATALIGYSRDGFAIYGPIADESELDACGGRYENFVYQYHVRTQEDFILGCYAGIPSELHTQHGDINL